MTQRDMEMLDLVKHRIQFTSPEGDYEGTVLGVCLISKKMLVCRIFFLPERLPMGTLSFQFREILSYTIISRPGEHDFKREEPYRRPRDYVPPRANNTCLFDDYSEAGDLDSNYHEVCLDDLYVEEAYDLKIPPQLASRIPVDNVTVSEIGDEFHQAVKHIKMQDCVGVYLEGPKIGRHGILNWLCVSTSSCTFLFDIQALGEKSFKAGLKTIFEDPNIEKVIHDCRQASDCLFHKYNTRLVNVFDTQVADLLVTMQRSKDGKFSKHVSSLETCLRTYLEIPEEYLHKPKRFRSYEDNVSFSRLRPLKSEQRDVMLMNVMYLRVLKRELNFALLTPLHRAVDVYLQVLQTATDHELLLEHCIPEEIPQELVLEGIQIVRFKEFVEVPSIAASGPPYRKLNNPIKGYVAHCKKMNNSQATIKNAHLSNLNVNNFVDKKCTAMQDETTSSKVNTSNCVKYPTAQNCRTLQPKQICETVTSSSEATKIGKSAIVDQRCSSLPKKNSKSVDSLNQVTKCGKLSNNQLLAYFSNIEQQRINRKNEELQNKNESANLRFSDCTSANTENQQLSDTSESETESSLSKNRYQDVWVNICDSQKPILAKSIDARDSSDSADSSEDDPWAALRSQFNTCSYSAETVKRKIRFFPA